MAKDYYITLGIPRTASQDEVKKAYRKLAHQYHPDKKGGDESKFKEVNEAYQILSDPKKRESYDHFGFAYNDGGFSPGGGSAYSGHDFEDMFRGFGGGRGGFEDIFDIFSDMMGGGSYARPSYHEEAQKGEDVYLEISLHNKDLGKSKVFEYSAFNICDECRGTGVEKGHKMVNCNTCGGVGQVKQMSKSAFGVFTRIGICPKCRGKKKLPEKECHSCSGSGRIKSKRKIEIQIPEDLESDYKIVVPKGGNSGRRDQASGDLIIGFKIK